MKKLPLLIVLVAVIVLGWAFVGMGTSGADLLADEASVTLYRFGNAIPDQGYIEVNFRADEDELWVANAFIGDEWVIKNQRAIVRSGYANRFAFTAPESVKGSMQPVPIRFELSKNQVRDRKAFNGIDGRDYVAELSVVDVGSQLGLDVPGASEELKRGVGVLIPSAEAKNFDVQRNADVPDLSGGPMDCSAIAATNNILSLMDEHMSDVEVPDPPQMIEELKRDMQWNNGIINPNFLSGKRAWTARYGLPIKTEEIQFPSMDDLEAALRSGAAVEVSTRMIRSASGKPSTGHTFTGVSAFQEGGSMGVGVHDPATPQGADMLRAQMSTGENSYIVLHYPLWDGIVFVDAIFVQTWEETSSSVSSSTGVDIRSSASSSSQSSASSSSEEVATKEIQGLNIGGKFYPVFQFHQAGPDACDSDHWHAAAAVYAMDGTSITDPARNGCGFGKVSEVPVETRTVTEAEIATFSNVRWTDL